MLIDTINNKETQDKKERPPTISTPGPGSQNLLQVNSKGFCRAVLISVSWSCLQNAISLPTQMVPLGSSLLPGEHSQAKEPALFLQTPFTQGLEVHSLISAERKGVSAVGRSLLGQGLGETRSKEHEEGKFSAAQKFTSPGCKNPACTTPSMRHLKMDRP